MESLELSRLRDKFIRLKTKQDLDNFKDSIRRKYGSHGDGFEETMLQIRGSVRMRLLSCPLSKIPPLMAHPSFSLRRIVKHRLEKG